ncbi:MAG: helix-turn-helix domain-containing protein [Actinomycetota bacterium]|nr:helix-turn-helix domain-containing protein [Actinomycetota bacterium]
MSQGKIVGHLREVPRNGEAHASENRREEDGGHPPAEGRSPLEETLEHLEAGLEVLGTRVESIHSVLKSLEGKVAAIGDPYREWLTPREAASYLRRTPEAFRKLVEREGVPRHFLTGRNALFSRTELDRWLKKR